MNDFKNIFSFLVPYKKDVTLSLLCHVATAIFTIVTIPLIIPFFHFLFSTVPEVAARPDSKFDAIGWLEYFFVQLIDTAGPSRSLVITCGFLVVTFFFKNLFRYLGMYFMIPVRSNIVTSLRRDLYHSFISQSQTQSQLYSRGDLITRMTADVQEVEWSILRFIQSIFKAPILILGSILLMLSIHKGLTLFVLLLMVFTVLVIGTLSKTLKKSSSKLQSSLGNLTDIVEETLDGALHLKVYRVLTQWKDKFQSTNQEYKHFYDKVTRRQELSSPLSEFLGVSVVVVLLWYGAHLVFKNDLKPEAFFAFVFAFYHVIEPLKSFSTAFYNIKKGSASLERIKQMTVTEVANKEVVNTKFGFNKVISFENVSFSYDAQKILDGVSLDIAKGEKIAIVGNSGAGKSTLVSLLLGVIEPDRGQISIDGQSLSGFKQSDMYKHIGLVTQKPFLYNDSIRANLTLGRTGITETQLVNALKLANADEFVETLDDGIETMVGKRGEQLSGGEGQRLTIARALLDNPGILILDEPTSSLDPASENKVSSAIISAMNNRTTIIIAHRLSTIKYCDRIIFLEGGKIVESGTHQELITANGKYKEYVALQTL